MAELPERLREAAGAHRPDRERMLARVEHAMRPPGQPAGARYRERPQALWVRIAAVTAAAAGAIGLGSLAVGAVSDGGGSRQTAATSRGSGAAQSRPATGGGPQPPAARRGAGPVHRHDGAPGGHHAGSGHPSGSPAAPAVASSPATAPATTPPPVSGPMTGNPPAGPGTGAPATATGVANAAGDSNWSQSDVRLTTHQELSALTVELRVARTNGVTATGSSTSIPQQTRVSVVTDGDYLIYRWSLDRGQTLAADTYTFAGRFGHAPGGRDTSRDRYAVAGVGRDGPIALGGGF